jgi:hypothetical protein
MPFSPPRPAVDRNQEGAYPQVSVLLTSQGPAALLRAALILLVVLLLLLLLLELVVVCALARELPSLLPRRGDCEYVAVLTLAE